MGSYEKASEVMAGRKHPMRGTCPHCGKDLLVPEERVPPGKDLTVRCPGCGGRFTVRRPSGPVTEEGGQVACGARVRAVICLRDQGLARKLEAVLQGEGVKPVPAPDAGRAKEILALEEAFLVLYQDGFDKDPASGLAGWLAGRSGEDRRRLLVVWLGQGMPSGDPLVAFSKSVDLVLDQGEIEKLPALLTQARMERERVYGPLRSVMMDLGMAVRGHARAP